MVETNNNWVIGNKGDVEDKIIDEVEETKSVEIKFEVEGEFIFEGEFVIIIEVDGNSNIVEDSDIKVVDNFYIVDVSAIKVVDNFDIVDVSAIKVVDNSGIVDGSSIKVVGNSGIVDGSSIKVVGNSGIVVWGMNGEVEIIVVWIKVEIKVVKEVGIVDSNNIVVCIGKVVTIIPLSILKPVTPSPILILQFSEIVDIFNT